MVDSLFADNSLRAAQLALDGLSRSQEVISQNVANIDTPGYHAQTVDFQTAIKTAMSTGNTIQMLSSNPAHITGSSKGSSYQVVSRAGGSERADQNNVDINVELGQMAENGIQFQAISQVVSQKLLLLKAIASK